MINKEYGSDFHYIDNPEFRLNKTSDFFDGTEYFYFSGRAALRAIVSNGIDVFFWKKLYIPTYYCHEVYDFIKDLNIEFEFYECNPLLNILPSDIIDDKECALLMVNYFGISIPKCEYLKNIVTIEDVTHDLTGINHSKADYVFGSLRKVIPLPVGGFAKSKVKLPEIQANSFTEEVVQEKNAGMLLKKKYLNGSFKEKQIFRDLLISAEHSFENRLSYTILPSSVKDHLLKFDVSKIIELKKGNSRIAKSRIKDNSIFEILKSNSDSEYALILKFNNFEERNRFKKYLILHDIYPIILWPNQTNDEDMQLENKLIFLHIDFRYSFYDIKHMTDIINIFSSNV